MEPKQTLWSRVPEPLRVVVVVAGLLVAHAALAPVAPLNDPPALAGKVVDAALKVGASIGIPI